MPRTVRFFMPSSTPDPAPAGLVYVSDAMPGIRRERRGERFVYRLADGRALRDAAQIERIRRLAIPPAYTDVWICPRPDGHLQATGRDARGRKQYRYHPGWRAARDEDKFQRLCEFGAALPRIRRRVAHDLAQAPAGAPPDRRTVLAALVRLLDTTLVRVGNDEYARDNGSYGLTTLRSRHAAVRGSTLRLRFRGKSGVLHEVALDDPRVARVVRRCQAMPGQELFQYEDAAGATHCVDSADVNGYLRESSGCDFSAKDFRTWHATVQALVLVSRLDAAQRGTRGAANAVLAEVAAQLRNTVAVCRKSYVHPGVLALADAAEVDPLLARLGAAPLRPVKARMGGLSVAEKALLDFLRQGAGRAGRGRRGGAAPSPPPSPPAGEREQAVPRVKGPAPSPPPGERVGVRASPAATPPPAAAPPSSRPRSARC